MTTVKGDSIIIYNLLQNCKTMIRRNLQNYGLHVRDYKDTNIENRIATLLLNKIDNCDNVIEYNVTEKSVTLYYKKCYFNIKLSKPQTGTLSFEIKCSSELY